MIEAAGKIFARLAHHRLERPLGEQDKEHEQSGVVGRQARRQPLHRQAPDQHHHGQQKVQPGFDGRDRFGQFGNLHRGREFGNPAAIRDQGNIGDQQQDCGDPQGRIAEGDLHPAEAVIDDRRQYGHADDHE
jgi:hypothetical protein